VTANAGCTWTATSNASFITITSGANSSGNGTVTATVAANTGIPRSGTLTVAGVTVTVNQAGAVACTFTLSTTTLPMRESGGTATINVTGAAGCAWTAVSNDAFITVTSGASGTWKYYKIQVPAGKSQLKVWLNSTQSCGLLSCNPDLDLYVRNGAKPTTSTYDCAPLSGTSTELCTITSPAAAWWYVGINVYSGSSTLNYTVTAKFP